MSGERDANPSGTAGADLLASLPADEPGGIREIRASLEALREEVTGLREAVQAPRAVTPEALEAWGEQFVERAAEAAQPEGEAAAAIAAQADRMAEAAAKTAAAAERIENGLGQTAEWFSAEIAGMKRWLAEDLSTQRASTAEIESTTARVEGALGKFRAMASHDLHSASLALKDIREHIAGLRFGLRAFLAPPVFVGFILGMVLESRLHILYGWLWGG